MENPRGAPEEKTDVLFSKNRFFSLGKEVPRFGNAKTDLAFLDIHT
jgi:hypothetical protein